MAAAVAATLALPFLAGVTDMGVVMPFGNNSCPGDCDRYGARDTWLYIDPFDMETPYHMHYDGAGPDGWLACLAVSSDPTLSNWTKLGPLLSLGPPGSVDSRSASYLTTYYDNQTAMWYGYYLGTNQTSPPPGLVPVGPYFTLLATARSSRGPWTQVGDRNVIPDGSPGVVLQESDGWWQFCTGCGAPVGLAKTTNLSSTWSVTQSIITSDPVENTSLYYEVMNGLWWLFTNHIGPDANGINFDDSVWVYWSPSLTTWNESNKAVVLNRTNTQFGTGRVGLPSVLRVQNRLAVLYDGGGTPDNVFYNLNCSVALAWIELPLQPPF